MRLRDATQDDVSGLLSMMEQFNEFEGITLDEQVLEGALRRLIAEPSLGKVWLIEEEGVAGYAVLTFGYDLEFSGRDAFLTEIFLLRGRRGQGLGKRVLAAIEQEAAVLGVHAIHLMVRTNNHAALALYQRAGYGNPHERVQLSKVLG